MYEAMNITVKANSSGSPFSDGLVERHNMIIVNMLDKIIIQVKIKALRKHNNINNSIIKNGNIQHLTQTQKNKHTKTV